MRKLYLFFVTAALALTACGNTEGTEAGESSFGTGSWQTADGNGGEMQDALMSDTERLYSNTKKSSEADFGGNKTEILLDGTAEISGEGAAYENGVLSITKGGVYTVSGEISDGMVYIETDENVMLVLNGVSVTNSKGAALYCFSAENLYLKLAEGTENVLADGKAYDFSGTNQLAEEDEPNAAVYSKDDLIICGEGALTVEGNYNTGISGKDDLTIESGTVSVTAVNNGIRGKDSLAVLGGEVTVSAGGDGIKSANDTDEEKGWLLVEGGSLTITAGEDGVQAETLLQIHGGEISVTTTGEVASGGNDMGWGGNFMGGYVDTSAEDEATSKGIKSGGTMVIAGGSIAVASTDHGIHGAEEIVIYGGSMNIASSEGKGISSHGSLTVNDGTIDIVQSTEGIESKAVLTVNGGSIHIAASDDGLNAGGGSDSMMMGGRRQQTAADGTAHELIINGGYIYLNADGDGIDSNGNITVNGGTVIADGPVNGANGALDCGDGGCEVFVNGGVVIAAGSRQMAEVPSLSSEQNSLAIGFDRTLPAGTTVCVADGSGKELLVYTLKKNTQHIVFSSPELASGITCSIYTDGTVNGVATDGLYTSDYDFIPAGNADYAVTVSSAVTAAGNASAGGMGGSFGGHDGNFGGMGGHGGRREDSGYENPAEGTMPDISMHEGGVPDLGMHGGEAPPDGMVPDFGVPSDVITT